MLSHNNEIHQALLSQLCNELVPITVYLNIGVMGPRYELRVCGNTLFDQRRKTIQHDNKTNYCIIQTIIVFRNFVLWLFYGYKTINLLFCSGFLHDNDNK